jgi:hypothetical protein
MAAGSNVDASALTGMNAGDQLAIINASNAAEIVTSKAAQDKLTNADAKSYARDMIREHTRCRAWSTRWRRRQRHRRLARDGDAEDRHGQPDGHAAELGAQGRGRRHASTWTGR